MNWSKCEIKIENICQKNDANRTSANCNHRNYIKSDY